jgi:predicted nucleotidyltransferase
MSELKNENLLPRETIPVLRDHLGIFRRALGSKLVGMYVQGSVAMGSFNAAKSDLDYLVVIATSLSKEERNEIVEALLAGFDSVAFERRVEMSVVLKDHAGGGFVFPTPYELHMGDRDFLKGQLGRNGKIGDDPDLACHFEVVRQRGVCVFGERISSIFHPVDPKVFRQSINRDLERAAQKVLRHPVYNILNLCRTIYWIRDGRIYSKKEGGELYLRESGPYGNLVTQALKDYASAGKFEYDSRELAGFVEYAFQRIRSMSR